MSRARRACAAVLAAVVSVIVSAAMLAGVASAGDVRHAGVVNADPANWTPHVCNGRVNSFAKVGNVVVAGGLFSSVRPAGAQCPAGGTLTRANIFAYHETTGALTSFAPSVPGEVFEILPSGDGSSVYVAGAFASVNGAAGTRRLARVDVTTGQVVARFRSPGFNVKVEDVELVGTNLVVGGAFTTVGTPARIALASLDATTGALNSFVNVPFAGSWNGGAVGVVHFTVDPARTQLLAIGNFRTVGGQDRKQVVRLDLTGPAAAVDGWSTQRFSTSCADVFDTYMRDLDYSPDGSYAVLTATGAWAGGATTNALCDSASRWEMGTTGPAQQPSWVAYSGGDTFYATEITDAAVYVGGHMRWLNNPYAGDQAGPGAVARQGIAALDPRNGLPLSWNPGRTRGVGVFDFLATDKGLWVGSDTTRFKDEYHGRIAFAALAGGASVPPDATGTLPGTVVGLGRTDVPGGPIDAVVARDFDGARVLGTGSIAGGGVAWGEARGAFMVDGTVFTGWSDGTLQARTFDGTTFGPAQPVDLHGLSEFATELPNVTSMFFDSERGRLYYTRSGVDRLFYRYFTPESRIVGAVLFDAGTGGGLDYSRVRGAFLVGPDLYLGTADGALDRLDMWDGQPVVSSSTTVSGPALDGHNWSARALFLRVR